MYSDSLSLCETTCYTLVTVCCALYRLNMNLSRLNCFLSQDLWECGASPLSCGRCCLSADAIWSERVESGPDTPGRCCFPPPRTAPSPECSYWLRGRQRGDYHGNQNIITVNPYTAKISVKSKSFLATRAVVNYHITKKLPECSHYSPKQWQPGARSGIMRRVIIF